MALACLIIVVSVATSVRKKCMDPQDIARQVAWLETEGVKKRSDQAERLGIGLSTLKRKLSKAGAVAARLDHSEWIPFAPIKQGHYDATEYRYLTMLSQAAQRVETMHKGLRATAVKWAREILEIGGDITYDPIGGWLVVTADPSDWYLKRLFDEASRFILDLPQLDDEPGDS